ncbi:hypothetical protein BUALT_Bualt13G0081400 [Buddleja alternifolia]|uniref:PAR1 protein n=1 Tax=Buddleja alternifolia TaxID=168488 RepID=A0AAV6WLE6_9LAMI|nr:hypothetical protein BUALT_Bualt13G0081400 [Buddleja alternifolia]
MCSFSVSSSGNRCLLETFESGDGNLKFQCKTSQVMAINMREYIESDECVSACGVDKNSFGISSDSLLDSEVTLKLCSPQCYYNCPNIIDLYYNLALAEGVLLPELCKSQTISSRRSVIQLQSSGAASGPMSAAASAPASAISSSSIDCAPSPM